MYDRADVIIQTVFPPLIRMELPNSLACLFREPFDHPHPITLPWQKKRFGKSKRASALLHHSYTASPTPLLPLTASTSFKRRNNDDARKESTALCANQA